MNGIQPVKIPVPIVPKGSVLEQMEEKSQWGNDQPRLPWKWSLKGVVGGGSGGPKLLFWWMLTIR